MAPKSNEGKLSRVEAAKLAMERGIIESARLEKYLMMDEAYITQIEGRDGTKRLIMPYVASDELSVAPFNFYEAPDWPALLGAIASLWHLGVRHEAERVWLDELHLFSLLDDVDPGDGERTGRQLDKVIDFHVEQSGYWTIDDKWSYSSDRDRVALDQDGEVVFLLAEAPADASEGFGGRLPDQSELETEARKWIARRGFDPTKPARFETVGVKHYYGNRFALRHAVGIPTEDVA